MLSIYFDEDSWMYCVVDDKRTGVDSILASVFDHPDAEVVRKIYEDQIATTRESLAQHFDEVYSDDDGPSWRTEDTKGGE
jgi:hypothetical protein